MSVLVAGLLGFVVGFVAGAIVIGLMAAAADANRHLDGGSK